METDGTFSFIFGTPSIEGGNVIQGEFENETTIAGILSSYVECVNSSGDFITVILPQGATWGAKRIASQESFGEDESNALIGNVWISYGPVGGSILSMVIDPVAPNTLYAGTFGGGVFKSTNSGENWNAFNTGLTLTDVTALAVNPVTPSILYAGSWGGGIFVIHQTDTDY